MKPDERVNVKARAKGICNVTTMSTPNPHFDSEHEFKMKERMNGKKAWRERIISNSFLFLSLMPNGYH